MSMDDIQYINECVDPVFRPLIEDMARRMPEKPTAFIKEWAKNPPRLDVSRVILSML